MLDTKAIVESLFSENETLNLSRKKAIICQGKTLLTPNGTGDLRNKPTTTTSFVDRYMIQNLNVDNVERAASVSRESQTQASLPLQQIDSDYIYSSRLKIRKVNRGQATSSSITELIQQQTQYSPQNNAGTVQTSQSKSQTACNCSHKKETSISSDHLNGWLKRSSNSYTTKAQHTSKSHTVLKETGCIQISSLKKKNVEDTPLESNQVDACQSEDSKDDDSNGSTPSPKAKPWHIQSHLPTRSHVGGYSGSICSPAQANQCNKSDSATPANVCGRTNDLVSTKPFDTNSLLQRNSEQSNDPPMVACKSECTTRMFEGIANDPTDREKSNHVDNELMSHDKKNRISSRSLLMDGPEVLNFSAAQTPVRDQSIDRFVQNLSEEVGQGLSAFDQLDKPDIKSSTNDVIGPRAELAVTALIKLQERAHAELEAIESDYEDTKITVRVKPPPETVVSILKGPKYSKASKVVGKDIYYLDENVEAPSAEVVSNACCSECALDTFLSNSEKGQIQNHSSQSKTSSDLQTSTPVVFDTPSVSFVDEVVTNTIHFDPEDRPQGLFRKSRRRKVYGQRIPNARPTKLAHAVPRCERSGQGVLADHTLISTMPLNLRAKIIVTGIPTTSAFVVQGRNASSTRNESETPPAMNSIRDDCETNESAQSRNTTSPPPVSMERNSGSLEAEPVSVRTKTDVVQVLESKSEQDDSTPNSNEIFCDQMDEFSEMKENQKFSSTQECALLSVVPIPSSPSSRSQQSPTPEDAFSDFIPPLPSIHADNPHITPPPNNFASISDTSWRTIQPQQLKSGKKKEMKTSKYNNLVKQQTETNAVMLNEATKLSNLYQEGRFELEAGMSRLGNQSLKENKKFPNATNAAALCVYTQQHQNGVRIDWNKKELTRQHHYRVGGSSQIIRTQSEFLLSNKTDQLTTTTTTTATTKMKQHRSSSTNRFVSFEARGRRRSQSALSFLDSHQKRHKETRSNKTNKDVSKRHLNGLQRFFEVATSYLHKTFDPSKSEIRLDGVTESSLDADQMREAPRLEAKKENQGRTTLGSLITQTVAVPLQAESYSPRNFPVLQNNQKVKVPFAHPIKSSKKTKSSPLDPQVSTSSNNTIQGIKTLNQRTILLNGLDEPKNFNSTTTTTESLLSKPRWLLRNPSPRRFTPKTSQKKCSINEWNASPSSIVTTGAQHPKGHFFQKKESK